MSFNDRNVEKTQLNAEQLQMLLNKMSSDERDELAKALKSCTTEVTMTRGIPITVAVLGSLYFARTRLPPQYHFGPKGWPFYAIMGIASLTGVNVLSMGMCRDRVQPFLGQMWQKYGISQSATKYDEIRRRNRQEYGFQPNDISTTSTAAQQQGLSYSHIPNERPVTDPYGLEAATVHSLTDGMTSDIGKYERTFDFTFESGASDIRPRTVPVPYGSMYGGDTPVYMSGTPTSRISHPSSEFTR
ncbi:unnamed protein product [Angiostrongylus costaricensis]|uniref:OCIA domain-containing protein n=1 Tax=Angiostrongylus costaricensis TaxID=334426 RepID=A0A0R3PNU3_ANGCS|nr:unnamed protein product [Angiostrongylus costaricensis]